MGFSKPSISHAVKVLREGGFLSIDGDGFLHLTIQGKEVAENIYEKNQFFTMYLIEVGVNPVQAEADACMMEHCISEESFQKIREVINKGRTVKAELDIKGECFYENSSCNRRFFWDREGICQTDSKTLPESGRDLGSSKKNGISGRTERTGTG